MRSTLVAALLLTALTGCSYVYEVTFEVRVAPELVSQGGSLILEIQGQESARQVHALPTDGPLKATLSTCCSPEPKVTLLAWIDQNGDNTRQDQEPVAWDPRGEIVLGKENATRLTLGEPASRPELDAPPTRE